MITNESAGQCPWFYPAYQSRFLVIIETGKESIVIFKDAIDSQSLSQLNQYLNANT
jgi:sRNA-binding regulator protein Hfq